MDCPAALHHWARPCSSAATVTFPINVVLHRAFVTWRKPSQWTAPLQLGSTVTFLMKVVLHRIYGWAAAPASPLHRYQTCHHPVKIDYIQVSFKKNTSPLQLFAR
jgi:hypothetical protein